ncbi:sugar ABC transporter ATP-binding protein, partial [Paenibacillus sp. TAF58]
ADYVVEMLNINKSFGGLQALKDVSFSLKRGEIHALVGENGAGKSTLMKIMSGAYQNDSGVIKIDGEPVSINNPQIGRKLGISIIYQEFALAPDLTVAENIYLAQLREQGRLVNWKKLFKQADELIESLGFKIDSRTVVGSLNVAYQQVVEIAKALSRQTKVLILDEPTAVLSPNEAENLFKVLLKLKEQGVSIVYISHRLEEIFRLSDQITVFKDGTKVGSVLPSEITKETLIQMMIGRNLEAFFPSRNVNPSEVILQVDDVSSGNKVRNSSFTLRAGEVLGIAG